MGSMNLEEFWSIIRRSREGSAREMDGEALVALTNILSELEARGIAQFEEHFQSEIEKLDTLGLRDVGHQLWVLNDDTWTYFLAWCVSQGRDFVERVAGDVAALRGIASRSGGPFDTPSGELFLYCADYARVTRELSVVN